MQVKVLRPFWYQGEVKAVGTTVDLPDQLAREVVFGGKAERFVPSATEAPAPAKQPLSAKSAPALAGKKGD
jgi:hypothetical protein